MAQQMLALAVALPPPAAPSVFGRDEADGESRLMLLSGGGEKRIT